MAPTPTVLALDFDGVICDGLVEYFQTAWRAYCEIWSPADQSPPAGLNTRFYALRPVVESGWEMPLVLRSLLLGTADDEILQNWQAIASDLVEAEQLEPSQLGATVDRVRDDWIAADLDHWLAQHRFYPGVLDRLQQILQSSTQLTIVTTKEGRFVQKLLQQEGIDLTESQIFGKEVKQPKFKTLRQLMQKFTVDPNHPISLWFVEDRLKTLYAVKAHADLASIQLFLADWGYNTAADRENAQQDDQIHLLSLDYFSQNFSAWRS